MATDERTFLNLDQFVKNQIIAIIDDYKLVYKIPIPNLNTDPSNDTLNIYTKIRELLLCGIHINIEDLFKKDINSFRMVLAAFFGERNALVLTPKAETPETVAPEAESPETEAPVKTKTLQKTDLLPNCQHHLHTIMVMCYAADVMQKEIQKLDNRIVMKKDKYFKLKDKLQEQACNMINHLYCLETNGPENAIAALQEDCHLSWTNKNINSRYRDYLNGKFNRNQEIMAIAYKADAMKFLSQKPCLLLIDERYNIRKTMETNVTANHEKQGTLLNMNGKLWVHGLSRLVYILAFAYTLCRFPIYGDTRSFSKRSWFELLVFVYIIMVLIAQIGMTIIKIIDYLIYEGSLHEFRRQKKDEKKKWADIITNAKNNKYGKLIFKYYDNNRLAMFRIALVVPLLVLEAARFTYFSISLDMHIEWYGTSVLPPIAHEILYCLLFAITTISSIRYFYSLQLVGFFAHIIWKMGKTVVMFTSIFFVFWFVLAVIHVSISRSFIVSDDTLVHKVSSVGKFEIFGEVQDEDRIGILTNCSQFNRSIHHLFDMEYVEASCLFRSSLLPFLVFAYIFITSVLLVNLLTAQLTKEYENESKKSRYYYGWLRYGQLAKIESKINLPPPFSLVYLLSRLIVWLFTVPCVSRNATNYDLTHFWCQIERKIRSGYTFIFDAIWKYGVLVLEGHPWGTVYKIPIDVETDHNKDMKNFLDNPPSEIWEQLKDVINYYEQKQLTLKKLTKAQAKLNGMIEQKKNKENERLRMLSRAEVPEDRSATPAPTRDIPSLSQSMKSGIF
ncbi:hypothetical protein L3Y34_004832 [Caenorhabditis briggsae]|uniref:Ion transport domain-containing protein n=1 Tax=Caenorhabditis briggsae TaxID=6238 RepID=A0AAE9AID1_CAEBR|nr:hypothetical protein L3Y34_004832 [Caenorhabditis briggsae]